MARDTENIEQYVNYPQFTRNKILKQLFRNYIRCACCGQTFCLFQPNPRANHSLRQSFFASFSFRMDLSKCFKATINVHISEQINSSELRTGAGGLKHYISIGETCVAVNYSCYYFSLFLALCVRVWFRAVHQFNECSFTSYHRLWNLTCYAIYRNNLYPTTVTIIDLSGEAAAWRRK